MRVAFLPPRTDETDMDDESATTSYELSNVSKAARRPSRGAGDGLRPFAGLAPMSPIASMGAFTPLDTPPLTPTSELPPMSEDKYAPMPLASLPPTPGEELAKDPFAVDTESEAEAEGERIVSQILPPVDRGYHAYSFLFAATFLEAVIWGLPFSVGVLHEYWASTLFPHAESTLTLASTLNTGLLFFSGAFMGPMFTAWPWYERHIQVVGLAVATVGLILSAFVTEPWQLLLTFGVMYPCSAATYLPAATNIFEWFQAKRGMATGIMYAGTGCGGTIYPIVVQALLKHFGYKVTMLALACTFVVLNSVCLLFTKRRIPVIQRREGVVRKIRPKIDWGFLNSSAPWIAVCYLTLSSLGNFIPLLWMPSYAASIGAKKPDGAAIVSIINGVSMAGNMLSGWLSDVVDPSWATIITSTIASLNCLLLWGFGTNAGMLTAFGIVWGMTGGSLCGYWAKMISIIAKDDPAVPQIMLSAFLSLKGIGAFLAGPISTGLLKFEGFKGAAGAYGSTNYGVLLIFTAVMTFVGALALLAFPKVPSKLYQA